MVSNVVVNVTKVAHLLIDTAADALVLFKLLLLFELRRLGLLLSLLRLLLLLSVGHALLLRQGCQLGLLVLVCGCLSLCCRVGASGSVRYLASLLLLVHQFLLLLSAILWLT